MGLDRGNYTIPQLLPDPSGLIVDGVQSRNEVLRGALRWTTSLFKLGDGDLSECWHVVPVGSRGQDHSI